MEPKIKKVVDLTVKELEELKPPAKRWTHLPRALRDRAMAIHPVICEFYRTTANQWIEGFLGERNPEREIAFWEQMAECLKSEPDAKKRRAIWDAWRKGETIQEIDTGESN